MKHVILISVASCTMFATMLPSAPTGISSSNNGSWLASSPIGETQKALINSVKSYPSVGTFLNEDGITHTAHQYINDRTLTGTVPPAIVPVIKNGGFSVMRGKKEDFVNYPKGAILFPDYPTLATKFDKLINIMITTPKFKAFFNKVHLNVLNELYDYLMNIYTNFNLQHTGISESGNTLTFNIPTFLQNEEDYDANKKTLIINHLVNIIESQMNGKIKSIMPNIPHLFATSAGKTLIQNDYSIDITQFIIKQIDPGMIKYKQLYLEGFVAYLSFFQEFTSYLLQPHPKKSQHFTAFVHIAETINEFLYDSTTAEKTNTDPDKQIKSILKKMNPPFFTFNYDDIRALKLIPALAKSLSPNSKAIGWPSQIVKAAEQGTFVSGHPIAYFKDGNGQVVSKAQGTHLFIVLQSGANFFEEELLAQPTWLNSWDGVVKIMRACFGDFSALLGLYVLDPCMEALIQNSVDTMNGKAVNESNSFTNVCGNLLEKIKTQKIAHVAPPKTTSPSQTSINSLLQSQTTLPATPGTNPSADDLTPSNSDLTPSEDDLSGDNSDDDLSPSGNDISDALNQ